MIEIPAHDMIYIDKAVCNIGMAVFSKGKYCKPFSHQATGHFWWKVHRKVTMNKDSLPCDLPILMTELRQDILHVCKKQ